MIHETAIIAETATVEPGVEIGPYAIIGDHVHIDTGTVIGPHVVVKGPTKLGKNNRIFQFASIGDQPQDLKYNDEPTELIVGDSNTIREYATINRGTVGGGGVTRIGNHNLLMAYIHVAHDCHVGDHVVFSNGASLAGHVTIGDYAILAGFSLVHQFCTVGEHAFLGLNSAVNKDVAPFMIAVGNYATARGINKNGLRRRGFSEETIQALHHAYMTLIRQRGDRQAALESLDPDVREVAEVQRIIEFIKHSERGVVR